MFRVVVLYTFFKFQDSITILNGIFLLYRHLCVDYRRNVFQISMSEGSSRFFKAPLLLVLDTQLLPFPYDPRVTRVGFQLEDERVRKKRSNNNEQKKKKKSEF